MINNLGELHSKGTRQRLRVGITNQNSTAKHVRFVFVFAVVPRGVTAAGAPKNTIEGLGKNTETSWRGFTVLRKEVFKFVCFYLIYKLIFKNIIVHSLFRKAQLKLTT